MKPVLFAGARPYGRAENISALYDAYQGEKQYLAVCEYDKYLKMNPKDYDLIVMDDFLDKFSKQCIMIWHAIQGGKHIGYDQPQPYIKQSNLDKIDYIIAAGSGAISMWEQCTKLPSNKILPLGMPRTDMLIGKKKGEGHTILANKYSYLYVPTFREPIEPPLFKLDYSWIDSQLNDNELFVVKQHMRENNILHNQYKHIIEISSTQPSTPYLIDCDIIITDYSSIIFDGYLLGKPAILYSPNTDYVNKRGMYMKYPTEYSSRYATNEQKLLNLLRSTRGLTTVEQNCISKVADMCDGHSCERVCNLIQKLVI